MSASYTLDERIRRALRRGATLDAPPPGAPPLGGRAQHVDRARVLEAIRLRRRRRVRLSGGVVVVVVALGIAIPQMTRTGPPPHPGTGGAAHALRSSAPAPALAAPSFSAAAADGSTSEGGITCVIGRQAAEPCGVVTASGVGGVARAQSGARVTEAFTMTVGEAVTISFPSASWSTPRVSAGPSRAAASGGVASLTAMPSKESTGPAGRHLVVLRAAKVGSALVTAKKSSQGPRWMLAVKVRAR